jgi:hypothetical protein
VLLLSISLFYGCKKECKDSISILTVTNITPTTASSGGIITSCENLDIFVRGVCWSKKNAVDIYDERTTDGYGTGTYTSSIIGLTPNTLYYIRAYAVNSEATLYSAISQFKTLN